MTSKPSYEELSKRISELERKASESETRLSLLVNQSPMAIITWDKNFRVVDWNKASEKFFGYSREEARGKHAEFIVPMKDRKHVDKIWQNLLELEGGKRSTNKNITKNGETILCEWFNAPVIKNQNEVINVLSLVQDVTEKKKLEEELFQAQKMEAIGTLAGGIAHDFNNILAAILGYAEIAKMELSDTVQATKDINQVITAGKRATELVKQILTFSRKTDQQKNPLRIDLIVKEALKLLRSSLPTTIDIHTSIDKEIGLVLADPTNIHQIVVNLCTNALHAISNEQGELDVSLGCVYLKPEQVADKPAVQAGSFVVLKVKDTGMGMDEKTMARIFEPYFTTKKQGTGTGLGLAVIHGIVEDCNGFIEVESTFGKGTTFQVFLPTIKEEHAVITDKEDTTRLPTGNERIFYIDDEPALIDIGQSILTRLGYSVTTATNSIEALKKFQEFPDAFDLVITDQTMPNLTGIELAQAMFKLKPGFPVILCTGYTSALSKDEAYALGIKKFVTKPLTPKTLAETVRYVLDEAEVSTV